MQLIIRRFAFGALCTVVAAAGGQQQPGQPQPGQQPGQQQPGQQQPGQLQQVPQQQPEPQVVATVNGTPITKLELDATVQQRLASIQQNAQAEGKQLDPNTVQAVYQQSLNLLIESRLIEEHAIKEGPAVEPQEVKTVIEGFEQQLAAQQVSLDQFLATRGYTREGLQKQVEGSLAWQKYQEQQLSPENLREFFTENNEQFQAESFEQAPQQQVVQAYKTSLWNDIVSRMKSDAEINVAGQGAPANGANPNRQPQPNGGLQQ